MQFSHTSRGNGVRLLICFFALTASTSGQSSNDSRVRTGLVETRLPDDCILNRILHNATTTSPTFNVCFNVPFTELCNHDDETHVNNYWMISIQQNCTIAYTAVNDSSNQQHQQIDSCQVIYQCWIVHNDKSVCLYLDNSSDAVDHNRLSLASMRVKEEVWDLVKDNINVFAFVQVNRQMSFFAGLYEATKDGEEIATFVMGNSARLSKVIVPFNGNPPRHRQHQVCAREIVDVTVTSHVIVTCEDQTKYTQLPGYWQTFNISRTKLRSILKSGLSKSYVSESGEVAMIVVTNTTSNITSNWLAYRQSPGLEKCVDTSATFNDGLLLEDDNSGVQFFAIFDGNLTVVNELCNGPLIIATDICHSSGCHLYQTEHLLYISDRDGTTVINPTTYEVITLQYDDIRDVLPAVETARLQCEHESPAPTVTTNTVVNTNTTPTTSTTSIDPVVISSTSSVPHTTTPTSTNVAVPTQSANGTTSDIQSEPHKDFTFLVVVGVGLITAIVLVAIIFLVAYCLKRKCQHKKQQTGTFQILNYNCSPASVRRNSSLRGQAISGHTQKSDS